MVLKSLSSHLVSALHEYDDLLMESARTFIQSFSTDDSESRALSLFLSDEHENVQLIYEFKVTHRKRTPRVEMFHSHEENNAHKYLCCVRNETNKKRKYQAIRLLNEKNGLTANQLQTKRKCTQNVIITLIIIYYMHIFILFIIKESL